MPNVQVYARNANQKENKKNVKNYVLNKNLKESNNLTLHENMDSRRYTTLSIISLAYGSVAVSSPVEPVLRQRKDYSNEQWNRLTFTERKKVLDHKENKHKINMKRNKLRKKRKK